MNDSPVVLTSQIEIPSELVKPNLSLIVPAYNEENTIQTSVAKIDRVAKTIGLDYEIIVVNDGSIDATERELVSHGRQNARLHVVSYDKNMGKGHALQVGFTHARGDIVVFIDGDLDIEPAQIVRYVKALRFGDVVVASKAHPMSQVEVPLIRKFLSRVFNLWVRVLTGISLKDTQTGLKAVRKETLTGVFTRLAVKRFAFDVELLAVSGSCGLKIIELPVSLHLNRPLFNPRDMWNMFLDLLGIVYRLRISHWYVTPSTNQRKLQWNELEEHRRINACLSRLKEHQHDMVNDYVKRKNEDSFKIRIPTIERRHFEAYDSASSDDLKKSDGIS